MVDWCHFPAEGPGWSAGLLTVFGCFFCWHFLISAGNLMTKNAIQSTGRVVSKGILSRRQRIYCHNNFEKSRIRKHFLRHALKSQGGAPWCAELLAHEGVVAFKATIPEVGQWLCCHCVLLMLQGIQRQHKMAKMEGNEKPINMSSCRA